MKSEYLGLTLCLLITALGTACSNGGGSGKRNLEPQPVPTWTKGVYESRDNFQQICQNPRFGTNPATEAEYQDLQGTYMHEKMWLRSYSNELYLWYQDLDDPNPGSYSVPAYFNALKTPQDRFHFTQNADDFYNTFSHGISLGYGIKWVWVEAGDAHDIVVQDVAPSAALSLEVQRGDVLVAVDGLTLDRARSSDSFNTITSAIYPKEDGASHDFTFRSPSSTDTWVTRVTASEFTYNPVPRSRVINHQNSQVGYLQFDDHNEVSEQKLIDAFQNFEANQIDDLILDLRYNLGGYLTVASRVAYMIAGPTATSGKTLEQLTFNDKHPLTNPITGQPLSPYLFESRSSDFADAADVALPSVNLSRVFILTSADTCSASEVIINGLTGIGINVIQIGTTTCGKPYGTYPIDNCGTVYFTLMFKGENDAGFGDFENGFSPTDNPLEVDNDTLEGCQVEDDLNHDMGDTEEALLAAALYYQEMGSCPPAIEAVQSFKVSPQPGPVKKAKSKTSISIKPKPPQKQGYKLLRRQ